MKMAESSMVFLLSVACLSIGCSLTFLKSGLCYYMEWELVSYNGVSIEMSLIFDWMSLMFMSFVCLISSMVLFYSGGYMMGDPNISRFLYIVLGFVASMLFLILSPNLISILLGWDGLGLVSYALVIYYQNEKSASAGMLTALSNRVGDVAILLSIGVMMDLGGWNFIFSVGSDSLKGSLVLWLIVVAAMTKSAQIPFSAWLPAAMAAPTPVSALVHSSTLVTAGIYLLIRFSPSLVGTIISDILLLVGCMTMFMAGLGANFETDLKKIIALSTLSQLGVMVSILGMGWAILAFFHLLTHALFKALLFMCAGSIIHNVSGSQDIRTMGSLVSLMPLSTTLLNLANLSLCGIPFLAGFYSKDLILEVAFMGPLNIICLFMYAVATGLTVSYSFRVLYYSVSGPMNMGCASSVTDEDVLMTSPMIILSFGAVVSGAVLSWLIFPVNFMICLSPMFKMLVLFVTIVGGYIGYTLNMVAENCGLKSLGLYSISVYAGSMWFLPFLSTLGVSPGSLRLGFFYHQVFDSGWSEYSGGQGLYYILSNLSKVLQVMQENSIKVYLLMMLVWSAGLLSMF
uniref:NADH dehydrogenase subunit 5 n=1 Tax=Palaemon macrodactylus TaxID=390956 RepID=UPI0024354EED|nr:NADH dehydrogenase subunit 5 [Palaemon macrodactylus]WEW73446.1 NADH dehydrogenase subunit 5 [Palaemon macrodactylus]